MQNREKSNYFYSNFCLYSQDGRVGTHAVQNRECFSIHLGHRKLGEKNFKKCSFPNKAEFIITIPDEQTQNENYSGEQELKHQDSDWKEGPGPVVQDSCSTECTRHGGSHNPWPLCC